MSQRRSDSDLAFDAFFGDNSPLNKSEASFKISNTTKHKRWHVQTPDDDLAVKNSL